MLLFLSVLFAGTSSAQEYYKWMDDRGVTHYGSQPPAEYIDSATKIRVDSSTPSGKAAAQSKIDKREKQLTEKAPSESTTVAQQIEKEQQEANKKNCEIYRKNITLISQNHRIREKNAEGEVVMLSEEEKQSRLKTAKDFIAEYCK